MDLPREPEAVYDLKGSDATLVHLRDLWHVCACAVANTGVPTILRLHLGRWCCAHAGCEVAKGKSSPNVSSSFALRRHDRPSNQAIQRGHRCSVSCHGRASWPALDDHM